MVRALLDGRKTQTRRLATSPLRRVEAGDRLYVREAWRASYGADWYREDLGRCPKPREFDQTTTAIEYLCDGTRELGGKGYPSIHMPRWASRLTLIVEDVRHQRLTAIGGSDAIAEGVERLGPCEWQAYSGEITPMLSAVESFATLWNSLHTAEGECWQDNPEIVALTFRVVRGNIDRIEA